MRRLGCVLVLTLLAGACASTKPVPIVAGDVCFHSRQMIVDTRYAAEVVTRSNHAFKFSSIHCLAEYVRAHPDENPGRVFVMDYDRGRLMLAADAHFVRFSEPEGLRKVERCAAFRDEDAAKAFAAAHQTRMIGWDEAFNAPLGSSVY